MAALNTESWTSDTTAASSNKSVYKNQANRGAGWRKALLSPPLLARCTMLEAQQSMPWKRLQQPPAGKNNGTNTAETYSGYRTAVIPVASVKDRLRQSKRPTAWSRARTRIPQDMKAQPRRHLVQRPRASWSALS
mmetsp:Transcript_137173/g.273699  ORF Transcript_137173/g.273699 Transcript_137173/m.273699 type:complete len:135 (+) Transcript_137173:139-543(+)